MNRPLIPRAYRVFRIDASGRIYRSHVLDCETDVQAIVATLQFADGHGVQLWDGSRKVADFLPPGPRNHSTELFRKQLIRRLGVYSEGLPQTLVLHS